MGALDEGDFAGELENGVKLGSLELDLKDKSEITVEIEDAVKVLLQGLGEDSNREGLKKTPLRVAKALREGTREVCQEFAEEIQDGRKQIGDHSTCS